MRPRYSLLDANRQPPPPRIASSGAETRREAQAGLRRFPGGCRSVDRPGPPTAGCHRGLSGCLGGSTSTSSSTAGARQFSTVAALYTAEHIFPGGEPGRAVRSELERMLDRVRQPRAAGTSACALLLKPCAGTLPIPPTKQMKARSATRFTHTFPERLQTVSTALNSGRGRSRSPATPTSRRSSIHFNAADSSSDAAHPGAAGARRKLPRPRFYPDGPAIASVW